MLMMLLQITRSMLITTIMSRHDETTFARFIFQEPTILKLREKFFSFSGDDCRFLYSSWQLYIYSDVVWWCGNPNKASAGTIEGFSIRLDNCIFILMWCDVVVWWCGNPNKASARMIEGFFQFVLTAFHFYQHLFRNHNDQCHKNWQCFTSTQC